MVFCRTSNRNCSCRREAVSAGWEGNARKPCCRLLDSKYCSNSRVSCCKLAAGKVSVLVPSSTKSPGGSGEKSHFGRQIITTVYQKAARLRLKTRLHEESHYHLQFMSPLDR
ncbi:hypothetical protein EYF80_019509 [Liparis tanakae]|uniref:Uncharacterized protein n=1 Tax=Liparis tanakae TaxID=230148 RepID=A0A4Z2HYA0_9TELE|nr:hypothetical protein EYF80_019509 [Liparis tanakae]